MSCGGIDIDTTTKNSKSENERTERERAESFRSGGNTVSEYRHCARLKENRTNKTGRKPILSFKVSFVSGSTVVAGSLQVHQLLIENIRKHSPSVSSFCLVQKVDHSTRNARFVVSYSSTDYVALCEGISPTASSRCICRSSSAGNYSISVKGQDLIQRFAG